jgi:flagella basal body P-ring formation protein FlgA
VLIFAAVLTCPFSVHAEKAAKKSADGISIRLSTTSEVDTDRIALGQIADIQAPDFLAGEIGKMDMGYAPKPGEIMKFAKDRLLSKMYSNSLVSRETPVSGPDTVYVKRSSQTVSEETVRDAFMKYAASESRVEDFKLRNFHVRGFEAYPGGELRIVFDQSRRFEPGGRFSERAGVHVNGKEVDTLLLNGWIDVYETLVCAKAPVKRKTVIQSEDLEVKRVNTSGMRGSYADSVEKVAGMISRSRIDDGDFIRLDRLENPPLVKRGEVVKLIASKGNLRIVTSGISREDGSADASVRVENLSSGRIVRGIVKGRSRVEVVQ